MVSPPYQGGGNFLLPSLLRRGKGVVSPPYQGGGKEWFPPALIRRGLEGGYLNRFRGIIPQNINDFH